MSGERYHDGEAGERTEESKNGAKNHEERRMRQRGEKSQSEIRVKFRWDKTLFNLINLSLKWK